MVKSVKLEPVRFVLEEEGTKDTNTKWLSSFIAEKCKR